jgi:hypothetical protein
VPGAAAALVLTGRSALGGGIVAAAFMAPILPAVLPTIGGAFEAALGRALGFTLILAVRFAVRGPLGLGRGAALRRACLGTCARTL